MATPDAFADFESLRQVVRSNTVDRLKQILTGFNDECACSLSKTGKKQDLIDRILRQLEAWRIGQSADKFTKARSVIYQVRNSGSYTPMIKADGATLPPFPTQTTYLPNPGPSSLPYHQPSAIPPPPSRYDPYRRTSASAVAGPSVNRPAIIFQQSPFLRVDQAVSTVVECPESASSVDRRQQTLSFVLNSEQLQKINAPASRYQLRLYCTSSTFHSGSTFRVASAPCPVEFPPACEVRVNNMGLTANLKGLKKKPGTAPPPDLGKLVRTTPGATNRVEMVYVNSQQPVHGKKYYLVVMMVEVTSIDELVERLKKGKFVSKEDVLAKIQQGLSSDDDIVAGQQKMSLKCPLSYARITTPCRSSVCVHPQCFDAMSWFSVNEQTTTWLCPVCERVLKSDDLIMDGYFYDILQHTPESVEDVMVEADGQWHTVDNKYGSSKWLIAHPQKPDPTVEKGVSQPAKPMAPKTTNGKEKARSPFTEVLILDSDEDEDEGRVKRELSCSSDHTFPPATLQSQPSMTQSTSQISAVIDLTLDSDEEEEPPRPTQKRKAVDAPSPTEQIWKKARPMNNNGMGSSSAELLRDNVYANGRLSPNLPNRPRNSYNAIRSHLYNTYNQTSADYRRPAESRW